MARLSNFARQNWGLVAIFLIATLAAIWFASRVFMDFLYFNDPRNVDVDLRPWMTARFIVLTYDLPRPLVFELLGFEESARGGQRLGNVAKEMGLTMEELTELVRLGAAQHRAGQP